MNVLKIQVMTDSAGNANFTIPTEIKNSEIEVIIVVNQTAKYDKKIPVLSQFFGKMIWKGDALLEQRKLRNEWK